MQNQTILDEIDRLVDRAMKLLGHHSGDISAPLKLPVGDDDELHERMKALKSLDRKNYRRLLWRPYGPLRGRQPERM